MNRKIELTTRESLINDIWMAEKRLREYDRFFKSLKEGQTFYMYGSLQPVKVLSWDSEHGIIVGEYMYIDAMVEKDFKYWELHKERLKNINYE
jgi:hypothetical protein